MIKILHVHQNFYPYKGGSTYRLLNLIRGLDKSKYEIHVLSRKLEGDATEDQYEGIHIHRYGSFMEIPSAILKLNSRYSFDSIHAHNYRPGMYAQLANLKLHKPMIVEMHSIYDVRGLIKNFIVKILLKKADRVIVISEQSKKMIAKYLHDIAKVRTIYNGISIELFRNTTKPISDFDESLAGFLAKASAKVTIGYIGSFRPFQGIDNIVTVINATRNDNVSYLVIGGSQAECKQLSDCIHNGNTLVHSAVAQEDVAAIYKYVDYIIMPRPKMGATESAVPLKPIEAMAAGCAVLSTDVGGMRELKTLMNSDRIHLFTIEEMKEFVNDPDLSRSTRTCPEELSMFAIEKQSKKLEDVYREII